MILLLWLQLLAATVVILAGAQFLTRAADVIAVRTGLGHSFVGVILLATATSLPELGTGLSSILLVDAPDLAMGAAFGSNLFNLFIIALLDLYWRQGPILAAVSGTALLIAWLDVWIIALGSIAVLIHHLTPTMDSWYLAPTTWVVIVVFVLAMRMLYKRESSADKTPAGTATIDSDAGTTLGRAVLMYTLAALTVIVGAIWLANIGDRLVTVMGWKASFVGTQFLALCTSLPELATSFAALRIGAPDLAITNVLGSNLFNMGFVVFLNDVAYRKGSIWSEISMVHALTGAIAILMTFVVMLGLRRKPDTEGILLKKEGFESLALIAFYVGASFLVFYLS